MNTLTKTTPIAVKLGSSSTAKLVVGDVIATKGTLENPQRLRRVDIIDGNDVIVSTPRTGKDVEAMSFPKGSTVIVVGNVTEVAAPTARPKASPKKAAAAPKVKAAPVKVTKVDAVAQTTPTPIHGVVRQATGRKMTPKAEVAPTSSIREAIRTELRSAVEALLITEIRTVIAEALA